MDVLPVRRQPLANTLAFSELIRENLFKPYRERIFYPAAATGAAVLLPLSFVHARDGAVGLAAVLFITVVLLGIDAVAIRAQRAPPVPFAALLVPATAGVAIALVSHGGYGALWAFPTVMFGFFVLRRRTATFASAAMVLVGAALLYAYHDVGLALRFFVALGLCVVILNVLLDVLDSLQAQILQQSVMDPPTGAFNRRYMETCLAHVVERRRSNQGTASLLVLDLDHFNTVNDRLGVEGGDVILRAFSNLLRERVRRLDLVFRSGGQRFVVLLPDTPASQARHVAEQLRQAVAEAALVPGQRVTVSIGVGEVREGEAQEAWIKRTSLALRDAKDEGRNRVMVAQAA